MVIYEINLNISKEIYTEYYPWLLEHIKQMLQFVGFLKAEVGIVEQENELNEKHLRICYLIDSYDNLQHYLNTHASSMRSEGIAKFGNKFQASRRIIKNATYFAK